jgi:hypothetical protein
MCRSLTYGLTLPRQASPSPQNGVCIPQRRYSAGTSLDNPGNQAGVPFIRGDGSYLPVKEALAGVYGSLIHRDSSVLGEAGPVVTIRFEVNKPTTFRDTPLFIGCAVAGIPVQRVPGESAEIVLPGGG